MIAPLPALLVLPAPFAYIQFPWRLLGLAGFLATTAVTLQAAALAPSRRGAGAALAIGVLLSVATPAVWRDVPKDPTWTSANVVEIGKGSYSVKGYTILGEYLPKDAPPDSIAERVRRVAAEPPGTNRLSWTAEGGDWVARLTAEPTREVVLPLVYYDLYRVSDGHGRRLPARSDGGLLAVRADSGAGVVRISRTRTTVELVGLGLSGLGILALLLLRWMPAGVSAASPSD